MKVKSESEVAQSCLTLSDPMNCSPPGSSVHGIFQARVLEWVPLLGVSKKVTGDMNLRQHFCQPLECEPGALLRNTDPEGLLPPLLGNMEEVCGPGQGWIQAYHLLAVRANVLISLR